jgi:hypothetical protein
LQLWELATYFTEIFIGIRMNSNQSNHSDGSFHIRETPLPKKKKVIETKPVETKKEVKHDKEKRRK